jgi:hypothetical protein
MSKRFIDTEMPLGPWYRPLSPRLKALWIFLLCRCDIAGVIKVDWGTVSFAVGRKCDESDMDAFDGNVVKLTSGRYFIPGFIQFQYGVLSEECRTHKAVLKLLTEHKIKYSSKMGGFIGLANPMLTLQDKDILSSSSEGGCKGETNPPPETIQKPSDFWQELRGIYTWLDLDRERSKMQAWLLTPRGKGRKLTRQFAVNWLNKADGKPIDGDSGSDEQRNWREARDSVAALIWDAKAQQFGREQLTDLIRVQRDKWGSLKNAHGHDAVTSGVNLAMNNERAKEFPR